MTLYILLLTTAALLAWIFTWLVQRHAPRLSLVQPANERSAHTRPTPNGGGLGIVLAGTASGAWLALDNGHALGWPLLGYSLIIAGVGLWDDIRFLPIRIRLGVHFIICLTLLLLLTGLPVIRLPFEMQLEGLLLVIILTATGSWWINLFNFMDGIDGIAASQAIFMLIAAALIALWWNPAVVNDPIWQWMLCLAVATASFLWFNWPPAKIFMGDVGSTYLALMIFALALISIREHWLAYTPWLVLGALFISDATVTLLSRMFRGERWYEAHNTHAYQVLSRRWQSHRRVTLLAIGINLLWLAPLAWACLYFEEWRWGIVALAYLPLIIACIGVRRRGVGSRAEI